MDERLSAISVIIPAYKEVGAVADTVKRVRQTFEPTGRAFEVIVVDDGSEDGTAEQAEQAGARVMRHPVNMGYGNAILTGLWAARFPLVGLTDADGTYPVEELADMADEVDRRGLDMLVGIRQGKHYHGSPTKRVARVCFRMLAEFAAGQRIPDINSGLRVIRRDMMLDFAPVACGGFSYSTTLTLISLLTSRFVDHRPIRYFEREGSSKVRYFRDTLRTAQILVMSILLFNPIKLYLLATMFAGGVSLVLVVLALLLPAYSGAVIMAGLGLLICSVLIGFGFLAEQRRVRAPARRSETAGPASPAGVANDESPHATGPAADPPLTLEPEVITTAEALARGAMRRSADPHASGQGLIRSANPPS